MSTLLFHMLSIPILILVPSGQWCNYSKLNSKALQTTSYSYRFTHSSQLLSCIITWLTLQCA